MTKTCTRCKKVKSLDKYFKQARSSDGKAYKCKKCTVEERRIWVKNNPEKYKAQLERRKSNPWYKNKANMMPKIKKQRKNRKNLSNSYVKQLICSKGTIGENINPDNISKELIEAYRLNIQLKRALGLTAPLKSST
tara:strand:- start:584 stop:991 length:408 start_codon:yes stop_codon:yes gene_type:complete